MSNFTSLRNSSLESLPNLISASSAHSSWSSTPSPEDLPRVPLIWRRVDFDQYGRMTTSDEEGTILEVYDFECEENISCGDPETLSKAPTVELASMSVYVTRKSGPLPKTDVLEREAAACSLFRGIGQCTSSTTKDSAGNEDKVKALLNKVNEVLSATARNSVTDESFTETLAEELTESPSEVYNAFYNLPFNFSSSLTL